MDNFPLPIATTLAIVAGFALWMLYQTVRNRRGNEVALRPLQPYQILENQIGLAVESGSQLHLTLGQAGLASVANPTSIAALTVLDALAKDGCANGTPPLVTVGEGTLLPAAQDSLLRAYNEAQLTSNFEPGAAQFIATDSDPFAYAAGVTSIIHQGQVSSNIAVGRFGTELGIISAAANRAQGDQVVGTDDPVALALAHAMTENVLIGEELLASGAYLEGKPGQFASLQTQDIARFLIALLILVFAIIEVARAYLG